MGIHTYAIDYPIPTAVGQHSQSIILKVPEAEGSSGNHLHLVVEAFGDPVGFRETPHGNNRRHSAAMISDGCVVQCLTAFSNPRLAKLVLAKARMLPNHFGDNAFAKQQSALLGELRIGAPKLLVNTRKNRTIIPLVYVTRCSLMEILNRIDKTVTFRRAGRLRERGELNGALAYLFDANSKRERPEYERAIVDLLLQAAAAEDSPNSALPVRPAAPESAFQAKAGEIPEVKAADFSASVLREAISRTGYLIVRGFFATADADTIRNCIDAALNARADTEEKTMADESPWYYLSPHFPGDHAAYSRRNSAKKFSRTGSFKVLDSPRGVCRVLQIYRKYRLKEVVDTFFGEPSVIAARKWVFRLVEPIENYGGGIGGGWHQDGQFMGEGIRALNMWVPVTDCGEGTPAPGITLIPKRIEEIVEYGTRGARLDWVVGGELVAELASDVKIISPRFKAGDALFFDHYSLHRSGHEIGQSQNRYALESWFYAKSAHAANSVIPYF